jgi:hypothetical protein
MPSAGEAGSPDFVGNLDDMVFGRVCVMVVCIKKHRGSKLYTYFTHQLTKQPVIQNASCAERSMREVHARVKDPPEGRTIELASTLQRRYVRHHDLSLCCIVRSLALSQEVLENMEFVLQKIASHLAGQSTGAIR